MVPAALLANLLAAEVTATRSPINPCISAGTQASGNVMNCALENSKSQQLSNRQISVTEDHGSVELPSSEVTVKPVSSATSSACIDGIPCNLANALR